MLNFKDWKLSSQDGTRATLTHANGHEMTIAMKALPKIQREQILRLAKVQQYKDGGGVQKFADQPDGVSSDNSVASDSVDRQPAAAPAGGTHITINAGGQQPTAQPAAAPPAQNPAAGFAAQQVPVQVPKIPNPVKNLGPNGTMNPEAVAKNTQEANKGQQAVTAAKAAAEAPLEQGYIKGVGQTQDTTQNLLGEMGGHVGEFAQYVKNNPINPNAYVENMGAGKRTLSGLGLILGGLGAGQLGSTDNPALRFLNSQIDRDIAGQQARVNNQRTVLGAYQDLYGAGVAANNLTKASLLDIYTHKANLIAAQLGTPQSAVAAQRLGAEAAIEKSKLLQDAAVSLPVLPGSRPTSSEEGAMNVPRGTKGPATPGDGGGMTGEELQAMHREQARGPLQAGIPSHGKESGDGRNPLDTLGDNNQILHPDAEHRLNNLRYGAPKDRQDFESARSQYDQAYTADQQLKQVNQVYKRLYGETNGLSGRLHRGINPHAIAAGTGAIGTGVGAAIGATAGGVGAVPGGIAGGSIGTAVGEGLGHGLQALTNSGTNQEYDRDLETLKGIISASLKNRGDMTVDEAVQKFAPTDRDSAEQAMMKREAFKDFIVSHVDKGIISLHGIAHKSR